MLFGKLNERGVEREAVYLTDRRNKRTCPGILGHSLEAVDGDTAITESQKLVGDKLLDGDPLHISDAGTLGARAHRVVEGEHSRLKLREADAVLLARIFLRKLKLLAFSIAGDGDNGNSTVGNAQCTLNGVGKSGSDILLYHETVDYYVDGVTQVFVELYVFGQIIEIAVHTHSGESALSGIGKHLFVHTLLRSYNR